MQFVFQFLVLIGTPCSESLRLGFWLANKYIEDRDVGPSCLITLDTIVSHVVRAKANIAGQNCWVTVMLDKVCLPVYSEKIS